MVLDEVEDVEIRKSRLVFQSMGRLRFVGYRGPVQLI